MSIRNLFRKSRPGDVPDLAAFKRYSMSTLRILQKQYILARDVVNREIPGDLVECGVCNGGSAAVMASALNNPGRRAWLYDSFEGLPAPKTGVDGDFADEYTGKLVGSEEKVREAMALAGWTQDRYTIRKGWFQDTFREAPLPTQVALLHCDGDWYDSVMLTLDTFYDLVPEGGIILLDDFGHWEGAREAFYDFVAKRGIKPLLERFAHTQAFWVKGRAHNREFRGQWEIP